MFCLRSWIPILFFLSVNLHACYSTAFELILSRTNASPIYLVLFISATYVLNRPCVYCSLLLCILVLSLFDFHSSWFEPRYSHPSTLFSGSSNVTSSITTTAMIPLPSVIQDTVDIVPAVVNSTAVSVLSGLKDRTILEPSMDGSWGEWIGRGLRKEWRINCFDVAIRL